MSSESNILFESNTTLESAARSIERLLCITFHNPNDLELYEYSGGGLAIYIYQHNLSVRPARGESIATLKFYFVREISDGLWTNAPNFSTEVILAGLRSFF